MKRKPKSKISPVTGKPVLRRGFAAMPKETQRAIASKGGKTIAKRKGWLAKLGSKGGKNSHGGRKRIKKAA